MWHNRTRSIRDPEEYLCLVALACVLRQMGMPAGIGLLRGRGPVIALSSATGPSVRGVLRDERWILTCGRGRLGEVDALDVSVSGRTWELTQ